MVENIKKKPKQTTNSMSRNTQVWELKFTVIHIFTLILFMSKATETLKFTIVVLLIFVMAMF